MSIPYTKISKFTFYKWSSPASFQAGLWPTCELWYLFIEEEEEEEEELAQYWLCCISNEFHWRPILWAPMTSGCTKSSDRSCLIRICVGCMWQFANHHILKFSSSVIVQFFYSCALAACLISLWNFQCLKIASLLMPMQQGWLMKWTDEACE